MKTYLAVSGIIALGIIFALWTLNARVAQAPEEQVVCTDDVQRCPDGSYVGRTGPNCEFAECASSVTSTEQTATTSPGIAPYDSGVLGTVMLGPTCPVERIPPDPACADRPYQTTVTVRREGTSATFAETQSDKEGNYRFAMPPGSYTITAEGGLLLPRCNAIIVTVPPTSYITADISCDTGIR